MEIIIAIIVVVAGAAIWYSNRKTGVDVNQDGKVDFAFYDRDVMSWRSSSPTKRRASPSTLITISTPRSSLPPSLHVGTS
jgi:hypothetical protein